MKVFALSAALLLAIGSTAESKTFVAICNDGQNVQLNIREGGFGQLYLKSAGQILEIASLQPAYQSASGICAAQTGMGGASALVQLCITPDAISFTVKQTPNMPGIVYRFCKANVASH